MKLYFRLFFHCLHAFFLRRVGVLDEIFIRTRAWPNDLDLNAHINNGQYFSLADLARMAYFIRAGLFRLIMKRGWRPVLGAVHGSFRRSIGPFERMRITCRVIGWEERWVFMEHRFETKRGTAAVVIAMGSFYGRDGLVPAREVMAAMGIDVPSPALPEWIEHWRDKQAGLKQTYF